MFYALMIFGLSMLFFSKGSGSHREITIDRFFDLLHKGKVKEVVIRNKRVAEVYLTDEARKEAPFKDLPGGSGLFATAQPQYVFEIGDLQLFEQKLEEAKKQGIDFTYKFKTESDVFMNLMINLLPWVILIGLWFFLMKRMSAGAGGGGGMRIFNIGKSKAELYDKDRKPDVSFKDVAGLEEAKQEVKEIVDFLKNPEKYTRLGGKIPKGVLLVGPPGTGKTLLAKAVAGEANVPFFSMSGSDFVEMFVGVGASRVRDLFKRAKEKAPSIIFIDEIDAIGRARSKQNFTGANDERENTLNQLLTEMDGFGSNDNVIVIGATNRVDVLDKALLRAGRFDRQIFVDLPDLNERKAIFKVHMKPLKLADDVDVDFLARQTPGFSGADIANVCNEAALIAARKDKDKVDKQDFMDAIDRIIGGLEKKNKVIKPREKKRVAHHEAGHALASWFLEHASPLVKVTIVPRGQSLGAAWYLPEERVLVEPEQMLDEMAALLAGRAAEEIIFGNVSTGALNDLERVTKQARAMVTVYGLNDKIGHITFYDSTGQEWQFSKPYSEKTAELIDEEIKKLVDLQYDRVKKLLLEHKDELIKLAQRLLEKEVLFKEDLEEILGPRPFGSSEDESGGSASEGESKTEDKGGEVDENRETQKDESGSEANEKENKEKPSPSAEGDKS
ncbi:MAG: ATP-dependent zinc metalloprotease FtsH [Chlorobi bacterium]|nr:ATP-dependent zinc metalloprotease FtsH [Chlorobiota bacterium]